MRVAVHKRHDESQMLRIWTAAKATTDLLSSSMIEVLSTEPGWFLLQLKTALLRLFLVIVFLSLSTASLLAVSARPLVGAVALSEQHVTDTAQEKERGLTESPTTLQRSAGHHRDSREESKGQAHLQKKLLK